MDPVVTVIAIVACLIVSGFFSGSETALLRLRAHDIDTDVRDAREPAPVAVRALLGSTSRLLVTILLGNNVVNTLATGLAATLAVSMLGEQNGILVSTIAMTTALLIFGEVLPKAVAARHPRRISYAVGLPLYLLHWLFRPVHWIFDLIIEPLLKHLPGPVPGESPATSEEVLRIAHQLTQATPESPLVAIMGATAGAAKMTVEEIMVPRTEIVAFPVQTPAADLLEEMIEERYTRVPIFEGDIDKILGIVHLKDLIKLVRTDGADLQGIVKPVLRVPERKPILRLLTDMQRAFVHVAIVKNEFGVTMGLVTQEDILEEIVGEIRDEFDRDELLTIRKLPDGSFQTLGRVKVLDFNRETGWDVPAERGDTLSGLVFNELGRAPRRNDVVRLRGYELTVTDISGTRITLMRLRKTPESAEEMHGDGWGV